MENMKEKVAPVENQNPSRSAGRQYSTTPNKVSKIFQLFGK
jgi:hypothetical protein